MSVYISNIYFSKYVFLFVYVCVSVCVYVCVCVYVVCGLLSNKRSRIIICHWDKHIVPTFFYIHLYFSNKIKLIMFLCYLSLKVDHKTSSMPKVLPGCCLEIYLKFWQTLQTKIEGGELRTKWGVLFFSQPPKILGGCREV